MGTLGNILRVARKLPKALNILHRSAALSWRTVGLMLAGLACLQHSVRAADPVPYDVTIALTGDAAMDAALKSSSTLVSLHDIAPAGPFALVARARNDAARFVTVMGGFGYYDGTAKVTIEGRGLDDPGLPDALDASRAGTRVPVAITLTPGPEFHLRHVDLHGDVALAARDALKLPSGAPARAADVLAAQQRLLAALRAEGHALAQVSAPEATLDPSAQALDVAFDVQAGPRVDLGAISVSGLQHLREAFVLRRLTLHSGEHYDPAKIEAARQDLASVGAIGGVQIETPDTLDAQGRLPVNVVVSERPLHAVNITAAFSTDQGGSLSTSWVQRDLFGGAEQLTLSAAATNLGGTASVQPGYNFGPTLTLPDWLQRGQSLTFQLLGVKESLQAYDRTAAIASVTLSRKLSDHWTASIGLSGEEAHFVQQEVGRNYTLAQVPLGLAYDSANSLFDPTSGVKASAVVTPTESFNAGQDSTFVIAQASASTYIDFSHTGRSVLALRGLVGGVEGASTFAIPPDQRFYGGGGGTIRGYRFQSVGPAFPDGNPIGGTSIDVGTVEFRQRIGASYGVVAFVDAGQVGSNGVPFNGAWRVGAGVGARYYTAIGPIRFDIAVPLIHQNNSDALEAYIGIGQAF
jgi:translocation and assembly module TamA